MTRRRCGDCGPSRYGSSYGATADELNRLPLTRRGRWLPPARRARSLTRLTSRRECHAVRALVAPAVMKELGVHWRRRRLGAHSSTANHSGAAGCDRNYKGRVPRSQRLLLRLRRCGEGGRSRLPSQSPWSEMTRPDGVARRARHRSRGSPGARRGPVLTRVLIEERLGELAVELVRHPAQRAHSSREALLQEAGERA